jgi:hypothetical protein
MARISRDCGHAALAAIVLVAAPMAFARSAEAAACMPASLCHGLLRHCLCRQGRTCPPNGGGSCGTLYVNTWSGADYGNDKPPAGGFLLALKDTTGTGSADIKERFGGSASEGGHGGTGIGLYKDALYAKIDERIVRYPLKPGETVPTSQAPKPLSRACRSTAIIRCTHSSSIPTAISSCR